MADNRENTLLQAIAEGESVDEARTADEVFLKAIADGTEKPEEIRNRLQYWLSQIDGGGGVSIDNATIEYREITDTDYVEFSIPAKSATMLILEMSNGDLAYATITKDAGGTLYMGSTSDLYLIVDSQTGGIITPDGKVPAKLTIIQSTN